MEETVFPFNPLREFITPEGCYILELSNSAADPAASIARARVAPGATTRWHRVRNTIERYIILEGKGLVEVGSLPLQEVNPGDVVLIPPGCRQRITNTGKEDLIFLCLCTPRFIPEAYEGLTSDPAPDIRFNRRRRLLRRAQEDPGFPLRNAAGMTI